MKRSIRPGVDPEVGCLFFRESMVMVGSWVRQEGRMQGTPLAETPGLAPNCGLIDVLPRRVLPQVVVVSTVNKQHI